MLVSIRIECDDEKEIYQHLSVIRSQLKKQFKKNDELEMNLKKPKAIIRVDDANCYGVHDVIAHIYK